MRRAIGLCVLLVAAVVSIVVSAQPGTPPFTLEQLEDDLYVLNGGCMCGNTALYITDGGVVMVDTKVAGQGDAILEQLRTVTDQPITTIINTHTHFDHTGANAEFGTIDQIVTHANAQASLMKSSCAPVTNCDAFKGDNARFLPNVTFEDTHTLTVGSKAIDLYYFGPGHTDGDAWVVFPEIGVAHGGDLFGAKGAPFIDTENGGTALGYDDTIARGSPGSRASRR